MHHNAVAILLRFEISRSWGNEFQQTEVVVNITLTFLSEAVSIENNTAWCHVHRAWLLVINFDFTQVTEELHSCLAKTAENVIFFKLELIEIKDSAGESFPDLW